MNPTRFRLLCIGVFVVATVVAMNDAPTWANVLLIGVSYEAGLWCGTAEALFGRKSS